VCFCMFVVFCYFASVLFAFLLCVVSSVLSQEIGCEKCHQTDPFCVEWDIKP